MLKKSIILLLFATITMIGCSSNNNTDKKTDETASQAEDTNKSNKHSPKLTETYWKLVSLQGEEVSKHEDQKEAHIILKSGDKKVTGNGSCNLMNGTYEMGDNNSITFSKIGTTMMSCPDMETEQEFLKALGKVSSYEQKSDSLMLNSDGDQTLVKFVSAEKKSNN